jgi:UDP-2,3-diacylglucosamine hydrolase
MHSIFVSDLHLTPDRPRATAQFFEFLAGPAPRAEALYILGDLFEHWVGDDDLEDAFNASIAGALHAVVAGGVALSFMTGNRDVLAGQVFAARCGARLIADPFPLDLYGATTLLMHGDTLCTGDVDYQRFRAYARDAANQQRFLAQPLAERKRQMLDLRAGSETAKQSKSADIMDVAPATVESTLRRFGYPRLIHGHTHRPGRHVHVVDGHECERWVLTDWYGRAGYVRCDAAGCSAVAL